MILKEIISKFIHLINNSRNLSQFFKHTATAVLSLATYRKLYSSRYVSGNNICIGDIPKLFQG